MVYKMKHTKKQKRRGGYYGFVGPVVPGGDAAQWGRGSEMGKFTADQINAGAKMTGGRRRKSRSKRKHRRTRRGGGMEKYGSVSAGFTGSGSRGMADYVGSSTRLSTNDAARGAFNDKGAHSGDFGSFGGMFPK
jgi:hypothetical protein